MEKIKLSVIKSNPNNPRVIKDEKFQKLVKSIQEFPKMMELRPMVVNEDMVVLGATLRLSGYTNWLKPFISKEKFNEISNGGSKSKPVMEYIKAKQLTNGYSLRYIYLIDKSCRITVPIIPFNKIDEIGAGMYKGKKISLADRKALLSGAVDSNSTSKQDA